MNGCNAPEVTRNSHHMHEAIVVLFSYVLAELWRPSSDMRTAVLIEYSSRPKYISGRDLLFNRGALFVLSD